MLASADGYCYSLDTYCGAKTKADSNVKSTEDCLPLGLQVVMELLNSVSDPTDHVVFFDNFFSSYNLLVALKSKEFRATGTLRENRLRKCPIPPAKKLKKQERGWLKYAYEETNEIFIAKWKNSSIVTLGTNYDIMDPLDSVKRWSKDMKKNVDTQRPHLCAAYVQGMGGVDSLDQAINAYSIGIWSKKWCWVCLPNCSIPAW